MLQFSIAQSLRAKCARRFDAMLVGSTATLFAACGGANLTFPCASKT